MNITPTEQLALFIILPKEILELEAAIKAIGDEPKDEDDETDLKDFRALLSVLEPLAKALELNLRDKAPHLLNETP